MADAQQPHQPPQQINHLPLNDLGQSPSQAGVTQASCTEFLRAADQGNASIPVGLTTSHQGQGLHGVPPVCQCLGQQ